MPKSIQGEKVMIIDKDAVKLYWDTEPCGTRGVPYPVGSLAYYEAIAERRDRLEPFIAQYAQFDKWNGRKVLEVGCGVGSDLIKFAKAGAYVAGIDLSSKSVLLARERLRLCGIQNIAVIEADVESLPYKENTFGFCYGWGSLHHTPDIKKAIREIYRVTKSGGQICVMLYHRHSIVALQMYILFGLLKGRPFRSIGDILANHHESVGTKAYTIGEVKRMFSAFKDLEIDTRITSYDLRYWRDRYLPMVVGKILPRCMGWNIIVRGRKP